MPLGLGTYDFTWSNNCIASKECMRKGNEPAFGAVRRLDGNFVALNLSWDYCSEHEWGIDIIRRRFGTPTDKSIFGLERRAIKKLPEMNWFKGESEKWDKKKGTVSVEGFDCVERYNSNHCLPSDVSFYGETTLYTGWGGSDFGAYSYDKDEIAKLKQLFEAFQAIDIVIWLGGGKGNPFANSGLILGIKSKMPQSIFDAWHQADKDHYDLLKEAEKSGIEKRLIDSKKEFFALSPKRQDDGSLVFWLNGPGKMYGWYTVKELNVWLDGGELVMK